MVIPISNSMINIIAVFGAGCADTLYLVVFILFFALLVALSVVTYLIYRKNQVYQASKTRFSDHEYLLRAFIDADNSLIYLKDEKLRYLFVNQAFLRFYEMKDEAAVLERTISPSAKRNSPG